MDSNHPALDDLLLWQSHELDPDKAAALAAHLATCNVCRSELAELDSLKEKVIRLNASEKRGLSSAVATKRLRHRRLLAPRAGTTAVASVLIVALVFYFLTEFTPEARADALLEHAATQQTSELQTRQIRTIESANFQCRLTLQPEGADIRAAAVGNQSACQSISDSFRAAGWTTNDPLSARAFQHWRKGLRRKRDSIRKLASAVEVSTSTDEGPIRAVTLRLRSSDDHPVYGQFEFAANSQSAKFEVTETAVDTTQVAAVVVAPSAPEEISHPPVAERPKADPLDIAEAETLLVLHRTGADQSVLIAAEREPAGIKIWGIAPTDAVREQLANSLGALPNVQDAVQPNIEQEQEGALPWQAYRGDAPPLAFDALRTLYPSDMEGRQKFLNDLDFQTQQLVAEAKSRDALLATATRLQAADPERADQLRQAASELEREMMADLASLRESLSSLTGTMVKSAHPLTSDQALRLYQLVHEVLFQAKSSDSLDLDTALDRIRRLLD